MRVVVPTCDAHVYVVPIFLKYWDRAWPDCPGPMTIVSNTFVPPVRDGIECVLVGPDEGWSATMMSYVEGLDNDDPFMLILEDYIITEIDHQLLKDVMNTAQLSTVGMVRLVPIPGPTIEIASVDTIGIIDKSEPYAISLQAAIWRPQVLRDLLCTLENAWQFETQGSRRAATYHSYEFVGTYDHAMRYQNYLARGSPREEAVKWVEDHP